MSWNVVALDSVAPQPWRNGGGLTRELLAWPSLSEWRVRMSVADVHAAGPFSRFDGVERWFAVLEGPGVLLRIPGQAHRALAGGEPLRFDGTAPVDCELLAGPTRDFNLMAPPSHARMLRVRGELAWRTEGAALLALYAHGASARVALAGKVFELAPRQLAWCVQDQASEATIEARDALWMEARA
jgi:hypothetical protein